MTIFIYLKEEACYNTHHNLVLILLLFQVKFNGCHYQLLRWYKRHEENKRKSGQERSSMQQAKNQCHRPTPWMQESVSMHKSPTPVRHSRMNQARSEEEEKERKRDRKDRGQEADGKRGSLTKTYPRNKRLTSPLVLRYMNLSNFISQVFFFN